MRKSTTIYITLLLGAALIAGGLNFSTAFAQPPAQTPESGEMQRFIRVSGSGSASAQPDTAIIVVGVRTEADDASAALTENNEQVRDLINTLQQAGIAQADIQTQRVNLYPRYSEQPNQAGQPTVTGYEATNAVRVRVRDIANVGQILDTTVQAGGNLIESIFFEVSDQTEPLQQAREAAFDNALEKAEQLAALAGVQLGEIVSISETSGTPPRPFAVGGRAEAADMAVPVEPGTQDIQVNLEVTWGITGGQAPGTTRTATPLVTQTRTPIAPTPTLIASPTAGNVVPTQAVTRTSTATVVVTTPVTVTESPTPVGGETTPTAQVTETNPVGSSAAALLRAQGTTVQLQGRIQQPFFPVTGYVLNINGEQVQAFEFASETDARAAADVIVQTGDQASALFAPHIYRADEAIILYFGNDRETLNLLSETFGSSLVG